MSINPEKQHFTMEEYLELLENSEYKMEYDHGSIIGQCSFSAGGVKIH